MDHVKQAIADAIAATAKDTLTAIGTDVEVSRVSPLETVVRVPSHHGPRYFTIKVTENT